MTTIIGAPRELGGKFLKMGCGESGLYVRRSFSKAGFRDAAIDFIKYLNKHFGFSNRFKGLQFEMKAISGKRMNKLNQLDAVLGYLVDQRVVGIEGFFIERFGLDSVIDWNCQLHEG